MFAVEKYEVQQKIRPVCNKKDKERVGNSARPTWFVHLTNNTRMGE